MDPAAGASCTATVNPSLSETLDAALVDLLRTADRSNALDEASIAAVESALLLVTVAEKARRAPIDRSMVEAAREALAVLRAAVVATTYAIRLIDDRRRCSRAR